MAFSRLVGFLWCAFVVACGGSAAEPGAGGASATSSGAGAGGGGGGSGCDGGGAPSGSVCVEEVVGSLVDEDGAPIEGLLTTVCGTLSCNPGESGADGSFSVVVGAAIPLDAFSTFPHAREIDKAPFYFPLPTDALGPVVDVGALPLLTMPAGGPPVVAKQDMMGAPAQLLSSNGVTLDIAEGVSLVLEFEDVLKGEARFDARAVPTELVERYAPGSDLLALWAFYPFEASFQPEDDPSSLAKARLSFPNDVGLPAGAAVELLAHGSFVFPSWVEPARFEVVATGAVSADGLRVEMDANEGIEILTWVGIRPAG